VRNIVARWKVAKKNPTCLFLIASGIYVRLNYATTQSNITGNAEIVPNMSAGDLNVITRNYPRRNCVMSVIKDLNVPMEIV